MTDPIAQGTESAPNAATTTPENTQTQPQPQEQNSGFQTRINELTAARRAAEEAAMRAQQAAEAQAQTIAQLTQQLTMQHQAQMQAQRPAAPALPALPEGLDPSVAQYLQGLQTMYQQGLTQFQQNMSELQKNVNRSLEVQKVATIAAQYEPGVAQRAQELVQRWAADGKFGTGWNVEDAIKYAMGERAHAEYAKQATSRQIAAFSGGAQLPALAAPAPAHSAPAVQPVPADIDSWPVKKQEEYWEKRVGDTPFNT